MRTIKLKYILAALLLALALLLPSNIRSAEDFFAGVVETYEFVTPDDTTVVITLDSMTLAMADSIAKLPTGDEIIETAKNFIGVRYRWGDTGPKYFDCSGFTSYVYRQNDVDLLRNSRSQFTQGVVIHDVKDLQKGDLVFFGSREMPRSVGHVGIVTGVDPERRSFYFIHASRTGVRIDNSSDAYYAYRYLGARRIVTPEV